MRHRLSSPSTRRRRRLRRRRWAVVVSIAAAVAAALFIAGQFLGTTPASRRGTTAQSNPAAGSRSTILAIGVDKSSGGREATVIVEFVVDPAAASVRGIVIDSNTFVEVPGRGYESIGFVYQYGVKTMIETIDQFLGVKTDHFVTADDTNLKLTLNSKDIATLFRQTKGTDLSRRRLWWLRRTLRKIGPDRTIITRLPVRPVAFGQQTYYQPRSGELARLTKAFWGVTPKKLKPATRVIILNGNGVPGIARKAANRLIARRFRILDLKNADNFDYGQTEIVFYEDKFEDKANEVARLLGTGRLTRKSLAQDVTDLVIVVGKDFVSD